MEIQEIKQQLSILKVLSQYQLIPDKNNRLKCPFHKDKTPSLQVYPETNTWTCFSSNCNAGSGDQIDFIMKYEKITKHEAILKAKELITNYGLKITNVKQKFKMNITITQEQRLKALTTAFSFFTRGLKSKPEKAIKYLETRALDYPAPVGLYPTGNKQ